LAVIGFSLLFFVSHRPQCSVLGLRLRVNVLVFQLKETLS
jgi:hypothetical protein